MSKIAFLFPGQGAQAVGMGSQLIRSQPAARELFERAAQILGYDLAAVCREGPAARLNSTIYSQPALFVTSLAALDGLARERPQVVAECACAAGLSLGEYTALVFSGALNFETGLRIVQRRAEAMQSASDAAVGGMLSVLGLDAAELEALCAASREEGEVLQVANHLCPGNVVVAGHQTACARLSEAALTAGAMRVIPLKVAGAFHTPLMESALPALAQVLADDAFGTPRLPVVSNVDGALHAEALGWSTRLLQQLVRPVLWEQSMRTLLSAGVTEFYEIGVGTVLRGLLRRIDRRANCTHIAA